MSSRPGTSPGGSSRGSDDDLFAAAAKRCMRDDAIFAAAARSCQQEADSSVSPVTPLMEEVIAYESDEGLELSPSAKKLYADSAIALQAAARRKRVRLSNYKAAADHLNARLETAIDKEPPSAPQTQRSGRSSNALRPILCAAAFVGIALALVFYQYLPESSAAEA